MPHHSIFWVSAACTGSGGSNLHRAVLLALGLLGISSPLPAIRTTAVITVQAQETVYLLNHRFILVDSDTVLTDARQLSHADYELDYARGRLLLKHTLPDSTLLTVSYHYLPSQTLANEYYYHAGPVTETTRAEYIPAAGIRPADSLLAETEAGELTFGGAKTITVGLGSSGLNLDQSLRLNIQGEVAGVRVAADLADKSTGLAPEGTTRELAELEQLAITFSSRRLSGTVGDHNFPVDLGRLGSTRRAMRGARLEFDSRQQPENSTGWQAEASYAKPRGRFVHRQFAGEDGKQGPYLLSTNQTGIAILPGSETVYLDGRQLVRGRDADYIIDYPTGAITFTNRQIITSRSRIEAGFESPQDDYDRTMITGGTSYTLPGVSLRIGAGRETDDPDYRFAGPLDSLDRLQLARAGDTASAWLPGEDSLGIGQGDYVRDGDHFRYVGRDSGVFAVQFTLVGSTGGDYRYDPGLPGFRYVGGDTGQYVARRLVRLPERQDYGIGSIRLTPIPGLEANLTGILSRRMRNLFAPASPKTGAAYDLGLSFTAPDAALFPCHISYERRSLGPHLTFPGQKPEADFGYFWNLASSPSEYTRDFLSAAITPVKPIRLEAGLGWLQTPVTARRRIQAGLNAWFARYRLESISSLLRHTVELAPEWRGFRPKLLTQVESDSQQQTVMFSPELGMALGEKLNLDLNWQHTRSCSLSGSQPLLALNIWRSGIRLKPFSGLDLDALGGLLQKSTRTPAQTPVQDASGLFGTLMASYVFPAGSHLRLNADQRFDQVIPKDEVYLRVTPGTGDFSQNPETKEFYPDTAGDFVRQYVPSGNPQRATTTSIEFSGGTPVGSQVVLSLGTRHQNSRQDTLLYNASDQVSLELELLPDNPVISATVTDNLNSARQPVSAYEAPEDFQNNAQIQLRLLRDRQLAHTLRFGLTNRHQRSENRTLRMRETGISGMIEQFIRYGLELEPRVGIGVRFLECRQPVDYGNFRLTTVTLGIRRSFSLPHQTAATLELSGEHRAASIPKLPYELALTEPPGWLPRFDAQLERQLGTALVLSGNYTFRKIPDRQAEHNFAASLRAYF